MAEIVTEFKIRKASNDDIAQIMEIEKQHAGPNPTLEPKIQTMIEDDLSYFLVATFKNEIAGYAGGIIRDTEFGTNEQIGYITHVGLSREFTSKGMGRMLGDKLLEVMADKCEKFRTILGFDRTDLQSFFNHLGFKRTDLLVYESIY
jgi:N-acetylglutamate synthase-like GNAT family acetyltransferase